MLYYVVLPKRNTQMLSNLRNFNQTVLVQTSMNGFKKSVGNFTHLVNSSVFTISIVQMLFILYKLYTFL